MSFEAEWALIKQEVTGGRAPARGVGDTPDAAPGAAPGAPGGDAGVASDVAAWRAAAQGVGTLAENLSKAGGRLYAAQQGMDTSLQAFDGTFETLAAQSELHPTWSGYVSGLLGRCDALRARLAAAGTTLCVSDAATKARFDALHDAVRDTPAPGGQGREG
ncbi:MAG: hypothetical protein HOY69_07280 [Streptomyces sp.]|nr:hypothetical protein [Streptomyces sp.]